MEGAQHLGRGEAGGRGGPQSGGAAQLHTSGPGPAAGRGESQAPRGRVGGGARQEKRRWRVGRIMRFVVIRTVLWGHIDDSGWLDLYDSRVTWFDLRSRLPEEFVHTENTSIQSFLLHFQTSPLYCH